RGYATGSLDGVFGPQTASAVRAFQADSGLVADGEAGPKTLKALRL
ncbi:MAG: peptidoglycan-binding protein, partial [Gammaproteobacteria bacterium]|nr:peptidoglycan-binding protein [Gammaproteobacteria bacterium]